VNVALQIFRKDADIQKDEIINVSYIFNYRKVWDEINSENVISYMSFQFGISLDKIHQVHIQEVILCKLALTLTESPLINNRNMNARKSQ